MIQQGLPISLPIKGYFTLEKDLINQRLFEIEDKLGYQKEGLKQGADFYLLSTPTSPHDFEILGTSLFPGDSIEKALLKKSLNSVRTKREHIQKFRNKRLIKVVPLQIHMEAMRQFLSEKEYTLIQEISSSGLK